MGVGVSSNNFGDGGCFSAVGLKPDNVGLVFGEAVIRRGFDTLKSGNFFATAFNRLSCEANELFVITRLTWLSIPVGLGGLSFDEVLFVSVMGTELIAATLLLASSRIVRSLPVLEVTFSCEDSLVLF